MIIRQQSSSSNPLIPLVKFPQSPQFELLSPMRKAVVSWEGTISPVLLSPTASMCLLCKGDVCTLRFRTHKYRETREGGRWWASTDGKHEVMTAIAAGL